MPTITKDYVKYNDENIYAELTYAEFEAYAKSVYDYLLSQNYEYFGTRGEQVGTLAGIFTTYYYEPATELYKFYVDDAYRFIYSDRSIDDDGELMYADCFILHHLSSQTDK